MSKVEKITKTLIIILTTAVITVIITTNYLFKKIENNLNGYTDYDSLAYLVNQNDSGENFSKLKGIYSLVKSNFYKDISYEELEEAAINGMLYGLKDEYSYYMNKDEYKYFEESTNGEYTGIGLYLTNNTELNVIQIISAIKDTPSYNANIKPGDYLIAVDDIEYKGENINEATIKIKNGGEGTSVKLKLQRESEIIEVFVERKKIDIYKTEYKMLENNIGYINIKIFDEKVSQDFNEAYKELKKQGINKLIIDVRDNPGGLLTEVVKICSRIIPKDKMVVYTIDHEKKREDYLSEKGDISIPIVVLTNEGSASGSEILAAAVKENGIGKTVGKTTYGKGLVQTVRPFLDKTALKITTSEYFTPNGNNINKIGVIADIEVENTDNNDIQLQTAIQELSK